MITFGSLFAGIGGFDLGFERAGLTCRWQVEIDPFCQQILRKHWPNVGQWDDVRTFPPAPTADWAVDVICGGFPCQDISNAGKRAGIEGKRSGLWSQFARVIRVLRPQVVVVENVAALLVRGLDRVLSDLAASGFDAEWDVLAASDFGAPHIRERVFILAYTQRCGLSQRRGTAMSQSTCFPRRSGADGAQGCQVQVGESVSDAAGIGLQGGAGEQISGWRALQKQALRSGGSNASRSFWEVEPDVGRVAHGVPRRVDRIKGLGNAVVPQVAEWIGHRIKDALITSK